MTNQINRKRKIGIIGGGAAGMMAAITAARQGAEVTILEGNDRIGKKILATGNGKCNLGNTDLRIAQYYTEAPEKLEQYLKQFGTEDTISFFQGLGLLIKDKNGYLYPACEQAAAVLDVLRYELTSLGVRIVTDSKAVQITREKGKLMVKTKTGQTAFDKVILTCGGKAAPKSGSDGSGFVLAQQLGHTIVPTVPALVQLKCKENYLKAVAGVRAAASVSVWNQKHCMAEEKGEVQLTDYGISGIPVFQLSRQVNYLLRQQKEVEVRMDFLPEYGEEAYLRLQADRRNLQKNRTVEEFFTGILHKKLMLQFIRLAGLKPGEPAEKVKQADLQKVYDFCKNWVVHVNGHNSYDNAQVCAGGVPLCQVTEQLESKKTAGVYFAGEILDVDGKCGGYNLQWAWCSGAIAGMAAALEQQA